MRMLYFDCFAGASGDMILGALMDLGLDRDEFLRRIGLLGLSGHKIEFETVDRSGISSMRARISVPDERVHRHLNDIVEIIRSSAVSDSVKDRAIAIFTRLANAEAAVHGIDVGRVHFHEVGAMDAIIDIVGACIGFEMLGVEKFSCSKIHVGSGFVEMAHGKFPVPPPAVVELLKGVPIYSTEIVGELTTPTGAAIISTICDSYESLYEMVVEETGYGAGSRDHEKFPNVIRLLLGESTNDHVGVTAILNTENLVLLETNLDDMSPQALGFVMERAFELGALDCWFTPIQMKKNRPATLLSILCEKDHREMLVEMIYSETTTLGIRIGEIERHGIEREIKRISTSFGDVDVKIGSFNGRIINAMPEYEQVRRLALENGVSFCTVRDTALAEMNRLSFTAYS